MVAFRKELNKNKINNDFIFECPYCNSNKHIYEPMDIHQSKFKKQNGKFIIENERVKCSFCYEYFELSKKNFYHANLKTSIKQRLEEINKMKRTIHEGIGGNFVSVKDIGEGKQGNTATLLIKESEDIKIKVDPNGKYGECLLIPVEINDGDELKFFNASPKKENALIEKLGEETDDWVGQTFEVILESCNVGDTGLMISILKE